MPIKRIPLNNGAEYDVLTKWRHLIIMRREEIKAVKRGYNRRFRRNNRRLERGEIED